jgi:hypothetical protein
MRVQITLELARGTVSSRCQMRKFLIGVVTAIAVLAATLATTTPSANAADRYDRLDYFSDTYTVMTSMRFWKSSSSGFKDANITFTKSTLGKSRETVRIRVWGANGKVKHVGPWSSLLRGHEVVLYRNLRAGESFRIEALELEGFITIRARY